jgi:hypothetical protein
MEKWVEQLRKQLFNVVMRLSFGSPRILQAGKKKLHLADVAIEFTQPEAAFENISTDLISNLAFQP